MKTTILLSLFALIGLAHCEDFRPLFNGKDLTGWTGDGYVVEDGAISCTPQGKNLFTTETFANYVLEFEFLLTPGANNGLGIHYPGTGDGAYTGMELQILDNTAEKYKDLKEYQFHGSLYTLAAAKKEGLKPVGEWNKERVSVLGDKITVELNGNKILDANLTELSKTHPQHVGVKRRSGHISFLGHGDKVSFRDIKIQEIAPAANAEGVKKAGFHALIKGDTLDGWKYESNGTDNWFVANGIIHHNGQNGKTNDLWTEEKYKDFTMVFDWRWSGRGQMKNQPIILPDGNEKKGSDGKYETAKIEELDSGIYLRGNTKSQINLWNWTVGSGEIYGYRTDPSQSAEVKAAVTPRHNADKPLGEWNRTMITVRGDRVSVSMNGKVLIEGAQLNGMPAEGPIGLQHHGQAIDFANIWVRKD